MDDISNVSHLKNTKPSKRTPSGPLTMTLRSKQRKKRQRYDALCDQENKTMYLDNRTMQKRTHKKRKACVIDENTTNNMHYPILYPVERIRKWFRKNRLYEDAYYDPTTSAENILE
eukprot:363944_1